MKASVAQVNRQILRPNFLCALCLCTFVLLMPISHYHFSLPVIFLLKDTDINCTSYSVQVCTSWCQPHQRALRFAQHNNNIFQQADCMHSLFSILWPKPHSICHPLNKKKTLLSNSKQCLCDVPVRRAPKQLEPMSIIMTCQNIAYIISHVNTEFWIASWGCCQPWTHCSRFTCPQIIPKTLAFGETCTFVHAVHRPSLLQLL
jgi:hypothetical protein